MNIFSQANCGIKNCDSERRKNYLKYIVYWTANEATFTLYFLEAFLASAAFLAASFSAETLRLPAYFMSFHALRAAANALNFFISAVSSMGLAFLTFLATTKDSIL